MKVQLYGLNKCDTCKKAKRWFDDRNISYCFTDYRDEPIDAADILAWAKVIGWPKVVNRASMTWRNLSPELKEPETDEQWLQLVNQNTALVRRPVIVTEKGVQFGFSEKKLMDIL